MWEEGQAPCFVLETTSESTHGEDTDTKRKVYERLGVDEYFQFDPLGDYLDPRLQGFRLMAGRYRPMRPNPDGSLVSQATGVVFRPDGTQLRLTDAVTGAPLLRKEEETKARRRAEAEAAAEAKARRQAEEARCQAEAKAAAEAEARRQAEERVRALEEEIARLRRSGSGNP